MVIIVGSWLILVDQCLVIVSNDREWMIHKVDILSYIVDLPKIVRNRLKVIEGRCVCQCTTNGLASAVGPLYLCHVPSICWLAPIPTPPPPMCRFPRSKGERIPRTEELRPICSRCRTPAGLARPVGICMGLKMVGPQNGIVWYCYVLFIVILIGFMMIDG